MSARYRRDRGLSPIQRLRPDPHGAIAPQVDGPDFVARVGQQAGQASELGDRRVHRFHDARFVGDVTLDGNGPASRFAEFFGGLFSFANGLRSSIPTDSNASLIRLISNPIQLVITAMHATGAAVESTMYASFSREMRRRSVTGRIVFPTISVLV